MKNVQRATHNHRRMGDVVVLQSTDQLAQVLTSASDTFWVKVTELTKLADEVVRKRNGGAK